eukprot:738333-Karenia_brevis.AAC.1
MGCGPARAAALAIQASQAAAVQSGWTYSKVVLSRMLGNPSFQNVEPVSTKTWDVVTQAPNAVSLNPKRWACTLLLSLAHGAFRLV